MLNFVAHYAIIITEKTVGMNCNLFKLTRNYEKNISKI